MLTVLDLFSGIGGFSLGLERTGGFKTIAFCEIDPFCQRVLAKHWPEVPTYEDIRHAKFERGFADVICGGFPCQDISRAGSRAGITGSRSGLWRHMVGAIRLVQPRYAIVENVAALLGNGLVRVLGDLTEIGYDAEWHCIPAGAVGAPHIRDRIWIVAYPQHPDTNRQRSHRAEIDQQRKVELSDKQVSELGPLGKTLANSICERELQPQGCERNERRRFGNGGWWSTEPDVGRVAYGVPSRMDRLKSLGNAVVPQIPEMIGHAILAREAV